jgi:lipoprotein-releasing system permease protein
LSWFIGSRFFFAGNRSRLASFISLLAMAGLVMGVGLLIVVLSLMNGFDREMRERILGVVPHIQLFQPGGMADWQDMARRVTQTPGVVEVSPFTQVAGMLNYRGEIAAVSLLGLAPAHLDSALSAVLPADVATILDGDAILVSGALARTLGVEPGNRLTVVVPRTSGSGNSLAPVVRGLRIAGLFDTHTAEDIGLAIVNLDTASAMMGFGDRPQGLRVTVENVFQAREMGYTLIYSLPQDTSFIDWLQTHGNLYQAIQMSRQMVGLLVFLIIAIAVFNVISMLVMTVVDKRPTIAILKTQGATNGRILRIFCVQGTLIGVIGCFFGVLLGLPAALYISEMVAALENLLGFKFLNAEIYPIDYLPSDVHWQDIGLIIGVALALNFLATLYPAWKAARIRPADVLRYE